jgi:hypothetical protein
MSLRRAFRQIIVIGLAMLIVALPLLIQPRGVQAIQKPENDDAFDVTAYNGAAEDELEVLPLSEFYPDLKFEFSFEFDVDDGGFFGDTDVSSSLSALLEEQFSPEEQFQKKSSEIEAPRANIQLSSANIEPGAEVVAVAQPQAFDSQSIGQDLFYAWALGDVAYNGVAAGADSLDPPQASSPKDVHSRPTQNDNDGDGMDDAWEERYGLNPNNPGDADEDLDGDGFLNDVYANADGEILILEPATTAGEPDESLTNGEEYVWGTDPTSADTDGDGFTDGQDIAGLGQTNLSLVVPPDASLNESFDLRLTILGNSFQKFDINTPLVKIDSTTTPLNVNDHEQVAASLNVSNANPVPGEAITLSTTLGQTDFNAGIPSYNWFVNDVLDTEQSGQSEFTYDFIVPEDAAPGDIINFKVQVLNFETQQEANAELDIRVAEILQLQYDPEAVVRGEPVTINALLLNETDPSELIFHWSVDGTEVPEQSGQGTTTFTQEVTRAPGSSFDIGLRVTTPDDSRLFAETSQEVAVQHPSVELVVSSFTPVPDETVTVVAIPSFFQSEQLEYRWLLDGDEIDVAADASSISFVAGEFGTRHILEVHVRSAGEMAESASNSAVITVAEPNTLSVVPSAPEALVASLRGAVARQPVAFGLLGVMLIGSTSMVLLLRRRRHETS